MELMQNNICNKLSFNYFYRFFNKNLLICSGQFMPLNAVHGERIINSVVVFKFTAFSFHKLECLTVEH